MKTEIIDLYKYFGLPRPKGSKGYLTTYIIDKYNEFCPNRVRPAMVVIPGGGYSYCSQRESEPIALYFLSNGYNAFVLDYSVAPVAYPQQLLEACMAIAYVKLNAKEFGVDDKHVAAIGFSAGGHLTGMLATMFNEQPVLDALKDKAPLCRPDAVILSYPVITAGEFEHKGSIDNLSGGDEVLRPTLALETRVTKHSSPAFIWATANDGAVPCENSFLMALAYRKNGVPFELHVFEDGVHGLSLSTAEVNTPNEPVAKWKEMAITWLKLKGFDINNN